MIAQEFSMQEGSRKIFNADGAPWIKKYEILELLREEEIEERPLNIV